jgi:hypothetical protein
MPRSGGRFLVAIVSHPRWPPGRRVLQGGAPECAWSLAGAEGSRGGMGQGTVPRCGGLAMSLETPGGRSPQKPDLRLQLQFGVACGCGDLDELGHVRLVYPLGFQRVTEWRRRVVEKSKKLVSRG